MKKKFALISIYNKKNIKKLCNIFKKYNIQIISTGSTADHIKKIGYKCYKISEFTNFKEILDGRVKSLHPLVHASILYDRENKKHENEFANLNFPKINFVIVNLYPFNEIIKLTRNQKKIIDMIDIGGVALLRSAAKNYRNITVICNTNNYDDLILNMNNNSGKTSLDFRKEMAMKIFRATSNYDNIISSWISNEKSLFDIKDHKKKLLRYGENPHQKSYLFKDTSNVALSDCLIKRGKELSYNNILDIDSAYHTINEFKDPTCVIIKHNNPCGVASNKKIINAFINAYEADQVSAFGGIVAFNRNITEALARIMTSNFFEIIIAPSFSKKVKQIFKIKKSLTLIETNKIKKIKDFEIKSVNDGYLFQQKNLQQIVKNKIKCVSKKKTTKNYLEDILFALKVCKHVKSNAIVLVNNKKTLGIGAGQMSRVAATQIALSKLSIKEKKGGFVAASDAFFPFTDNLSLLIQNNCAAIIQPKGSINDKVIIKFVNKYNLPLYFSNYRFFKH